jgi:hypothetical protein
MAIFSLIHPLLLAFALATPALRAERKLPAYLRALAWVFFVHLLPLIFFGFSTFLIPDWKGAALMGWLDGFHEGKLALSPLVLWAVAASWVREVWGGEARPWIVLGYLAGALSSATCLLLGALIVPREPTILAYMSVPLWTALVYGGRAVQLLRARPPSTGALVGVGGAFSGLLVTSLLWSHHAYQALPDEPPDCFVVTAASRGHRSVVGARAPYRRGGRTRLANAQLRTFWAFEDRWAAAAPRSHRAVRWVYGYVGPLVARRMGHPLVADAVFLALKPLEWALRGLGPA